MGTVQRKGVWEEGRRLEGLLIIEVPRYIDKVSTVLIHALCDLFVAVDAKEGK